MFLYENQLNKTLIQMIMELLEILLGVFGILQIILFFKLWAMTNNVKKIYDLMKPKEVENNNAKDDIPCKFHIGDYVIRKSDGKQMKVESIYNGKAFCKTSSLGEYKYFSESEIKLKDKDE